VRVHSVTVPDCWTKIESAQCDGAGLLGWEWECTVMAQDCWTESESAQCDGAGLLD